MLDIAFRNVKVGLSFRMGQSVSDTNGLLQRIPALAAEVTLKRCTVNDRVAAKDQPDPTVQGDPCFACFDLAPIVYLVGFLSESGEFAGRQPYFGCGGHGCKLVVEALDKCE
jgi:hypothetical protein